MKYEIEFIHKMCESNRNIILTFGETDAMTVAKKCFEYGKSGNYIDCIIRHISRKE